MKCPFRTGIAFEYDFIGKTNDGGRDRADSSKYIESAQHSVFEECYEDECPYYYYDGFGGCKRLEDD